MSEDRSWDLPESKATDEHVFRNRRRLLKVAGFGGALSAAGIGGALWYRGSDQTVLESGRRGTAPLAAEPVSAPTENHFFEADRPISDQAAVARYVNYYEFSPQKWGTWRKAEALPVRPWTVTVDGLVQNPRTFDIDELPKLFGNEQRVYRHRCVETWAMVVPWDGFPLRKLIDLVQPLDSAKYVRFVTADIEALTGVFPPDGFDWPYQEALTIDEATNELAFLATGFYGEPIFKQNGAPVRLVLPWKYGFKSAKSLVRIEFTRDRPATFWNAAAPHEYGFYANVDPSVDHPRWSQNIEWMIEPGLGGFISKGEVHPTRLYNGYEEWVSDLYTGDEV